MLRFNGDSKELKSRVWKSGIEGEWKDDGCGKIYFQSRNRGTLSFWPSTRTIYLQGHPSAKREILLCFECYDLENVSKKRAKNRRVAP